MLLGYRIVEVQKGYAVPSERTESWLTDVARVRETLYANQDTGKKTIWIVGGSNALFGIDSEVIASITNYNVRNYSLHASFHGDIIYSQIIDKVKSGDIVVSSREWSVIDTRFGSKFDYENYIRHFAPFTNLSPHQILHLYMRVPLRRWLDGLVNYIGAPADAGPYWSQRTEQQLAAERAAGNGASPFYSHAAMNRTGDLNVNAPMTRAAWVEQTEMYVPAAIGENGISHLKSWQSRFHRAGAKFFSIMPVMIENSSGQMSNPEVWQKVKTIRDKLADGGVPLHCAAIDSVFSSIYRLDTFYHLNAAGARLRSRALGLCLKDEIDERETTMAPIDPENFSAVVRERFAAERELFGEGNLPYQINLRAMKYLSDRLTAKYAGGEFPLTQPVENLALELGLAVVPTGMTYYSNGKQYGFFAYERGDGSCPVIAANWPERIYHQGVVDGDKTRCTTYGYWNY